MVCFKPKIPPEPHPFSTAKSDAIHLAPIPSSIFDSTDIASIITYTYSHTFMLTIMMIIGILCPVIMMITNTMPLCLPSSPRQALSHILGHHIAQNSEVTRHHSNVTNIMTSKTYNCYTNYFLLTNSTPNDDPFFCYT